MVDRMRLDVSRVPDLDLSQGRRIQMPPRQAPAFGQQTLIETALMARAATRIGSGGLIRDLLDVRQAPSFRVDVVGSIRAAAPPRPTHDYTFALGPSVSGTAVATLSVGGGIYLWVPPDEFGLFGSVGLGITTNIGFSGGGQFTMLFGPAPVMLAGDSLAVGVQFNIPGAGIGLGGFLIFSMAAKPELRGFSVAVSAGFSALPVDVTVQASTTLIKPLGHV